MEIERAKLDTGKLLLSRSRLFDNLKSIALFKMDGQICLRTGRTGLTFPQLSLPHLQSTSGTKTLPLGTQCSSGKGRGGQGRMKLR